jgi:hypothetical protein
MIVKIGDTSDASSFSSLPGMMATIIYNASIKQCKIPSQWKEQANGKMH